MRFRSLLGALVVAICPSVATMAVEVNEDVVVNSASGTFGNTGEDLLIANNTSAHLILENGGTAEAMTLRIAPNVSRRGELTVRGSGSLFDLSSFNPPGRTSFFLGQRGTGVLNIEDGGAMTSWWTSIGESGGASGHARVDGVGSVWKNAAHLYLGWEGEAVLDVVNGGKLETQRTRIAYRKDARGIANVVGAGSVWDSGDQMAVGHFDNSYGELNILDGGKVTIKAGEAGPGLGLIGRAPLGGTGVVNVDGNGSIWETGQISVGLKSRGIMNIRNGGRVEANLDGGHIGHFPRADGEANVVGPDSVWALVGDLNVGFRADGVLNINNGGKVENASGSIGTSFGPDESEKTLFGSGRGSVNVEGLGSVWQNSGRLNIADDFETEGTMNIHDGGRVHSTSGRLGSGEDSMAIVNIMGEGSVWSVANDLSVGRAGDSGGGSSTLAVGGRGYLEVGGNLVIRDTGSVDITAPTGQVMANNVQMEGGRLSGMGTVTADLSIADGVLSPGSSAAGLTIDGGLTIDSAGTLKIELADLPGTNAISLLDVTGPVVLGGDIHLFLADDFGLPQELLEPFELITSGSELSGGWSNSESGEWLRTSDQLAELRLFYGPESPFGANRVVVSDFRIVLVPEPATMVLLLPLLMIAGASRRAQG